MNNKSLDCDSIVDFILELFARRGAEEYMGEKVSIAQHMEQSAACATDAGASDELVIASLLHDIGHFVGDFPIDALENGIDNLHEEAGARFLETFYPASVTEPIRHHVAAKRYLCATDPEYLSRLSEASVHTLKVQGGPMNPDEIAAFEKLPYLDSCLQMRIWDDEGKDPDRPHPDFSHYRELVQNLVQR